GQVPNDPFGVDSAMPRSQQPSPLRRGRVVRCAPHDGAEVAIMGSVTSMRVARWAAVLGAAGLVAACGSSNNTTSSSSSRSSSSSSSSSSGGGGIPANLSVTSFDSSFSIMASLKGLHDAGKGKVGVILPDTTSSTRYVDYDAPMLTKAFQIANAQGSDATELSDAQADVTLGVSVLVFDPLDSTVGSAIQSYAQSHGVATISYDRATFTGTNTYYVSFDNVQVGKLIGQGFVDCVTAWNVANPKVFTLN